MNELVSLRFVEDHRNAVILGPVGVGKTFLANALGHLCCRAGFNVRLLRADALLRLLKQSRMDNSREAVMTQALKRDHARALRPRSATCRCSGAGEIASFASPR